VRIDHVIYAAADLDPATARLAALLELPAAGGGRHDGMGTHNRIIPLGGGFLEVLAVADADEAAGSPLGRAVLGRIEATGEGLMGWAVAVEDVGAIASARGLPVTTIGRQGMTARLAGVAEAMAEPMLPFFIERDPGIADPGSDVAGEGIAWIEVGGDAARLHAWLGRADVPVHVVEGPAEVRAMCIGERELRGV
jgi:hypothetical protein